MLCTQYRRIKIYQRSYFIFSGRQYRHIYPFVFVVVSNVGIDGIPDFGSILLYYTGFINYLYKWDAAAIHNWNLGAVYFNQAVIYSHSY